MSENSGNSKETRPVKITADSTVDLSGKLLGRFNISIIPLTIVLGEEVFPDGESFTPEHMYERYHADGLLPKTAAPGTEAFEDFFRSFTDAGYDVVHLDISSELSSTCSTAAAVARECEGVYVIDTRQLSTGIGLLAIEAAECAQRGMSAGAIAAHIEEIKEKVSTSFVLDTLEFMWKGGRCSAVTAFGANLLRIKLGIEMRGGRLEIFKKYRGSSERVWRKYIEERLGGKAIRPGHIFFTESGEIEPAVIEDMIALVRELSGCREVHHTRAGCTISSHCGPRCMGVLFIEE